MSSLLFIAGLNLAFFGGCFWSGRKKEQDLIAAYLKGFANGLMARETPSITIRCNCPACSARRKQGEARA